MEHLGLAVLLVSIVFVILLFAFYIFPYFVCASVLAGNGNENIGQPDISTEKNPILQFCLAQKR